MPFLEGRSRITSSRKRSLSPTADHDPPSPPKRHKISSNNDEPPPREPEPGSSYLENLPYELISRIFASSSNPHLPLTSRTLFHTFESNASTDTHLKLSFILSMCGQKHHVTRRFLEKGWFRNIFGVEVLEMYERSVLTPYAYRDATDGGGIPPVGVVTRVEKGYMRVKPPEIPDRLFREPRLQEKLLLLEALINRNFTISRHNPYPLTNLLRLPNPPLTYVRLLLTHGGCNIHASSDAALLQCVKMGRFELVKMLVEEFGADVNGKGVLRKAVDGGRREMVEWLMGKGSVPGVGLLLGMKG
ncbi:hypothetical protein G7K_1952-t1 [Saitoella complicata NRRL Y-17804]|uniref:Uncharacterized protein n=2 Tax=Saitoella complicata (strain BCRC 22490 / CBS 7301 / JCM 7358 / NBRC 10748 / NRRL Y-17804) TaxID=698492 RepID=A0A0E9ND73_SAICN|nr:hypothetical protein G7K_1952-t1 [Saitoella complicata NRRL Y-17804]